MAGPPAASLKATTPPPKLTTDCKACLAGVDHLTRCLIQAVNNHDYDDPIFHHVSRNVTISHDFIQATDRKALRDQLSKLLSVHKTFHINIKDLSVAEIDHDKGTTKAWLTMEVSGVSGILREGVSEMHWRISQGEWCLERCRGLAYGGRVTYSSSSSTSTSTEEQ